MADDLSSKGCAIILCIALAVGLLSWVAKGCGSTEPSTSSSTETQPRITKSEVMQHRITRSDVIKETQIALDLAQLTSGTKASGFTVDDCLIGASKATCHFHCYVSGEKYIGGIEFSIRDGKLYPTGQVYLDKD